MTTEELRDWHAIHDGWVKCKLKNRWHSPWNNKCGVCDCNGVTTSAVDSHAYLATLDGAASAMPDEWWWLKNAEDGEPIYWFAFHRNSRYNYQVIFDSGDEIHDRYLLAKLAKEAMNAQSR